MTKHMTWDQTPRDYPIWIVPNKAKYEDNIHPRVLESLDAYFNQRKEPEPFTKYVLENNLAGACRNVCYLDLFDKLPNRDDPKSDYPLDKMLFATFWIIQELAPSCAHGNRRNVKRWLKAYKADVPRVEVFQPMFPDLLDCLLDAGYPEEALVGRYMEGNVGHGYLGLLDGSLRHRIKLFCEGCYNKDKGDDNKFIWFYCHSGLHLGAWCYGTDDEGTFANLRDQSWYCDDCHSKSKAVRAVDKGGIISLTTLVGDDQIAAAQADPEGHVTLCEEMGMTAEGEIERG